MKTGEVRNGLAGSRKSSRELYAELSTEITVPDEKLKEYVDDIFREDLRVSAYRKFLEAKTHPTAVRGYYHLDRKSTRLNSSHVRTSRMPSSA